MRGTSLRSCMILLFVALALSPARGQTLRTQLIEAIEGAQPCGNTGIRVFSRDERRAVVVVAEVTGGVVEGTITVFAKLTNTISSAPLPFTADIGEGAPVDLVRLRPSNRLKEWFFSTRYRWLPGRRGGVHDESHVYALPYDPDQAVVVIQGRLGPFSHGPGSETENAIDFGLPEGSTVRAARSGVVVALRDDFEAGGVDPKLKPCGNYVIIRHADGTYGNYVHSKPHTVRVRLRESVAVGTALAQSGNTGYSSTPHLHFDVFRIVDTPDGARRESLRVAFNTAEGVLSDLGVGHSYLRP
jgi:murein DD-endopeptidase MepM/ murein hydrolase activator NlpD